MSRNRKKKREREGVMAKYVLMSLFAGIVIFTDGCATRNATLQDVKTDRAKSAKAWILSQEQQQADQVRLEGKLSIQDALRLAMEHNKGLQTILQEREIASGRVQESYSAALPHLSANASYTRLDEVAAFDVGGQEISMGFEDNYSADLTVRQPIFHGGAIPSALRVAKLYALLSDEKIRGATQGTIFQVSKSYFDVLLANHLLQVNEDAVKSAKAHLSDVQKTRRQGMASEYDVLRAEVEVSNFSAELIKQKNALNIAETTLFNVMGVSQESEVILSNTLKYNPVKPVFAEAVGIARKNRSDLYQAEFGVRMQKEALRIAKSSYWPQIDAFVSQKWASPDPHSITSDEWGDAWTAGASITLPLFDGFNRKGKIVQERARLKQAKVILADIEEQIILEVKQAVLNVKNAEEFVESQKMNLNRAKEGLRLVQAGYREGINSEVQVTDARTALTRTQALYYQAIYAHTIAQLNLQLAMGTLGPEAGNYRIPESPGDPREHDIPIESTKTKGEQE